MRQGWLLAVVLVMTGCVQSASVVCGDGTVCPEGATCDVALGRCITEAQTQACATLAEGDPCSIVGAPGECRRGACEPLVCGDGRATGAEACDGDDLAGASCASLGFSGETTGVRCNELCRLETTGCTGICGDGVRDGSELCDGANPDGVTCARVGFYREVTPGPLTCNGLCGWTTSGCADYCGDGITNGPELCDGAPPVETCVDLGFDAGRSGCSPICGAELTPCARFGFRPELAAPGEFFAFHASGVDEQWVVGSAGTAAHRTASGWATVTTPTTQALVAVWSVSPGRAWAVGAPDVGAAPSVIRWDGVSWQMLADAPSFDPLSVWGTDVAVFVGTSTGVWTWSAAGWSAVGTLADAVTSIAGTSATDLWATLPGGAYHWDGTTWTLSSALVTGDLQVRALDDVYAIGTNAVLHWNGTGWTSNSAPVQPYRITATAPNDVWVTRAREIWHFDGLHWLVAARRSATVGEVGIVSFGVASVVSATSDGVGYTFRGQVFRALGTIPFSAAGRLWSDGNGASAAISSTVVGVDVGNGWVTGPLKPAGSPLNSALSAVWGLSSTAIWAGGGDGNLYRFDGTSWSLEVALGGLLPQMINLGGSSASDRWVIGSLYVHHYDGTTWTAVTPPPGTISAADVAGTEVWIATTGGQVSRWDGAAWQPVGGPLGFVSMKDLEVLGPDNVYLATDERRVLHFDGVAWTSMALPTVEGVLRLDSTAPDDVFALTPSQAFHFDGEAWSEVRIAAALNDVVAHPHQVDFLPTAGFVPLRSLLRTRPWNCRATETACADGVDDDCDGVLDVLDSDCP